MDDEFEELKDALLKLVAECRKKGKERKMKACQSSIKVILSVIKEIRPKLVRLVSIEDEIPDDARNADIKESILGLLSKARAMKSQDQSAISEYLQAYTQLNTIAVEHDLNIVFLVIFLIFSPI